MLDLTLNVGDTAARIALVPGAIELLGDGPELHDQVAGQVLRLGLAPFLLPEANKGRFVIAHNDPGVRAADEGAAVSVGLCPNGRFHVLLRSENGASKPCPYGVKHTKWVTASQQGKSER